MCIRDRYNEVEKFDYMEFNKVLDTFSNHSTTIINYFEERLTNASAESFNAKIKAFRSQLRGVADLNMKNFRVSGFSGQFENLGSVVSFRWRSMRK